VLRDRIDGVRLYVPSVALSTQTATREALEQLRSAIEAAQVVVVSYRDEKGQLTEGRRLRPLALLFWGSVWTLVAWCELRVDFRSFRVDRFQELRASGDTFVQEAGQRYEDFLAKVRAAGNG
jgi:predicted DNA-binding transcriptional regulator YafY